MAYAIAHIVKLKGGGGAASDRHVERQRETPNADRDKLEENVRLIGEERPLREMVTEMIDRHGGCPRKDSVECVELLLAASPEHFTEGRDDPDAPLVQRRAKEFADKATEFLREQYGERAVKAVLHLDEKTPHVHGFIVPLDGRGKLNCKALFGGRDKLRAFQNTYAEKMKPLGLERGVEGSRATHTDVKHFYAAINREVQLEIDRVRVPDPPRVMMSEASRRQYKEQAIEAVSEQLFEPVQIIYRQSLLTREEKRKREAAEKQAKEAERRAAKAEERAEQRAEKEIAQARGSETEWSREQSELQSEVARLDGSRRDIPLVEIMSKLSFTGDRGEGKDKSASTFYRDAQGAVALTVTKDQAMRGEEIVARSALELVIHMRESQEQTPTTPREAITWLADKFGKDRAVAAAVAHTTQAVTEIIREHERTREPERARIRERERSFDGGRMSR